MALLDAEALRRLRIRIDVNRVLPESVLADVGEEPVVFWIVEAAATNGAVTEERRAKLVAWAEEQNIRAGNCGFSAPSSPAPTVPRNDGSRKPGRRDLRLVRG